MNKLTVTVLGTALLALAPAGIATAAEPAYRVLDLGPLPGASDSWAYDVNDAGVVVGESGGHAVRWVDGRISDLEIGESSRAVAVNRRGVVAAELVGGGGGTLAVRCERGTATRLVPLPGDHGSSARAINDRGEVLGTSTGLDTHAVLWRPDGTVVDLTALTGLTQVNDLDEQGRYVGAVDTGDDVNGRPALWQRGRTTLLSETRGTATAINDRGEVAGWFSAGDSFTWDRGRLTTIPKPADVLLLQAVDLNDRGEVVLSDSYRWDGRALTRLPGGVQARGINDRGAIVGYAGGLDPHGVLLLPRR